jgi:hypothetical protein
MKKFVFVLTLIIAVVISHTMVAQDKPVEKKVEKVIKVKKSLHKEGKEKKECAGKIECSKDKKCCDKCTGEKCEMGKKEKCAMDSTATCEKKDMKKHMEKKTMMKKDVKGEEKK